MGRMYKYNEIIGLVVHNELNQAVIVDVFNKDEVAKAVDDLRYYYQLGNSYNVSILRMPEMVIIPNVINKIKFCGDYITYTRNRSKMLTSLIIEVDNKEYNVKIGVEKLLANLKHFNIINGEINNQEIAFIKQDGLYSILPKSVIDKDKDNILEDKPKASKTIKRIPGHLYSTEKGTIKQIYICEAYSWIRADYKNCNVTILDKPDKVGLYYNTFGMNCYWNTLTDFFKSAKNPKYSGRFPMIYELNIDKQPPKTPKIDLGAVMAVDDYEESFRDALKIMSNELINQSGNWYISEIMLYGLAATDSLEDKPEISDEVINKIPKYYNVIVDGQKIER